MCIPYAAVDSPVPGFPLSTYLKSLGAKLGRTTLMLSCQTISKISSTVSGSSLQLIFWRALLQVILKRKFPELYTTRYIQPVICSKCQLSNLCTHTCRSHDITVGRLRHKPDDFIAYVKTAAARLKLDISNVRYAITAPGIIYSNLLVFILVQVTDVEMLQILAEYQHKEAQLKAFLQVSHTFFLVQCSTLTENTAAWPLVIKAYS